MKPMQYSVTFDARPTLDHVRELVDAAVKGGYLWTQFTFEPNVVVDNWIKGVGDEKLPVIAVSFRKDRPDER